MDCVSPALLVSYRDCPRCRWFAVHHPRLLTQAGQGQAALLAVQQRQYLLGRQRVSLPDAVCIAGDVAQARLETEAVLALAKRPMFHAVIESHGVHLRCDVLAPGADGWQLLQCGPAPESPRDCVEAMALHAWLVESAGLPLSRVTYLYAEPGATGMRELRFDLTPQVRALRAEAASWALALAQTAAQTSPPPVPAAMLRSGRCDCAPGDAGWGRPLDVPRNCA